MGGYGCRAACVGLCMGSFISECCKNTIETEGIATVERIWTHCRVRLYCNWIGLCSNQSKVRKTIVKNLKREW